MAAPALADRSPQPRALPLREVRTRLTQLVTLAELTDTVTVVTRDGDPRPIAAIVPAPAARTAAQARADAERVAAISAGWSRRLEESHRQSSRRHAAERRALADALAEVWAELDRRVPAGDPALARLRAAHADLLRD
ncbi:MULTISPECIES: type II toxin-antitoxin system Phd/YefM family antitoxin [Micromonospora]|uniref:Type II toxin-antitoxin system Phd/YefM family antitoxin n=1 Tax=Micromonospora solifontis TaxID=2487138 RepID=A0ABX9WCW6_9ACTN|nr:MULTISPECIES: type II toxin-antitoxin system Phd/YefM family antitoxin [Micromonospora]NES16192.1 type II toxin-antitoxin system Phd/YefM family antitoxin [Micromonospora sp. PPF5-17B]NES38933.1 type II toxin-antitoxin system Phd/YefM family antitoxin [Micromonospora solifontis]NES57679.1 type II toxin-antitoxin system Phd/YefM family antitoxin [Micromonospora sp. PPF5-6]RNL92305.1 type II toxin-antitoxin system Phd/YefM family antitoxin [Micromonospora solifontis]